MAGFKDCPKCDMELMLQLADDKDPLKGVLMRCLSCEYQEVPKGDPIILAVEAAIAAADDPEVDYFLDLAVKLRRALIG